MAMNGLTSIRTLKVVTLTNIVIVNHFIVLSLITYVPVLEAHSIPFSG